MKLLFLISLTLSAAIAEFIVQTPSQIATVRAECANQYNIPQDYIEKFKRFEYPDDEITHCYVRCAVEKLGFWTDEQGFITNNIIIQLGKSHDDIEVHKSVEKCVDQIAEGEDNCHWAYRNFKCLIASHLLLVKNVVN